MIHVIVTLTVRPHRLGDFLALATSHQAASLTEPGCRRFELLRDLMDPFRYTLYEEWRDRAALREHQQTPHYDRWRREIPSIQAGPREHHECEPLDGRTTLRVVFTNGCFD